MNNKDIVITAGTAIGSVLALARSIKKEVNCNVFVLCTDKQTSRVIEKSKFIKEVCLINSSVEKQYITIIKKWYEKKDFIGKPILYFTTDTSCFYVDNNRDWFDENFTLCLPSSSIIQDFTQKGVAEKVAEKAGLIVPKSIVLESKVDVETVIKTFSFPVIIKPLATYLKNGVDFKIKVFHTQEEFIFFTSMLIEKSISVLCQEFIPGGNDSSYYYLFYRNMRGEVIENTGRKILQSSPNGGIMAKGLTIYNKELSSLSKSFLEKINYIGMGGIEFKKYQGKYYFIEMSVRLEGFFKIAEIAKSPLSLYSYYDLTNNKNKLLKLNEKYPRQEDDFIYIDLNATLVAHIKGRSYLKLIKDLLVIIFDEKVKLNVYAKNDSKPFWSVLRNVILK